MKKKDRVSGIVLIIISLVYLICVKFIPVFTGVGAAPLNSRFFPILLGILLCFFGAVLVLRRDDKTSSSEKHLFSEQNITKPDTRSDIKSDIIPDTRSDIKSDIIPDTKSDIKSDVKSEKSVWGRYKQTILTILLLSLYVSLLQTLGFLICTFLYLLLQVLILSPNQKKKWVFLILMAAVISVSVDYVFAELLHVMLPRGLMGF